VRNRDVGGRLWNAQMLKVSIVTVAFNSVSTIRDTIESVLGQSYARIEYIVIDGGSTDGTVEVVREYGARIAHFVSEPDRGLYDAMNKGVALATGDFIGLLNSDDIYQDADVVSSVVAAVDHGARFVYGDLVYVRQADTSRVVRYWRGRPYTPSFFERGDVPPHPTLFVRSDVYAEVGGFKANDFRLSADYEFMLRAFGRHGSSARYVPRTLVRMRLGGETNRSIRNILQANFEVLEAWRVNGRSAPWYLMPVRFLKRIKQFVSHGADTRA
jgi:glycosyltransferase involved in cell wall biosynthesis